MEKSHPLLKLSLVLCIMAISSNFCFAQNQDTQKNDAGTGQLLSVLSLFKLAAGYTNSFPLYNMSDFSKCSVGAVAGFEFALLPSFLKNTDLGFYGRTAFQNFIPYSLQLTKLYSYSFGGGLYGETFLPQAFSLAYSVGAGFLISEVNFVSAEKSSIDDVYYDFMLESDVGLRKKIVSLKNANLIFSTGCHFAFYNEKSESFCTLGPTFSILVDFKTDNVMIRKTTE